jgi:hypothetical protein
VGVAKKMTAAGHRVSMGWLFALRWEALRYLLAGAARTGFSFGLYLGVKLFLPYQVAFSIAFIVTVCLSTVLTSHLVFFVQLHWLNVIAYVFIYTVNYLLSLELLAFAVERVGIGASYAPLLVIPALLPIGFTLERLALVVLGQPKRSSRGPLP